MTKFIINLILFLMLSMTLMAKEAITFEAFFTAYRVNVPVVSPDGEWITFSVKKANIEKNSSQTDIWIMKSSGEDQKQITSEGTSNSSPAFSNDSRSIYYLSNQGESTQIWNYQLGSGEKSQVTDIYGGVNGFVLSPDNSFIILERDNYPDCTSEDCIKKRDSQQGTAKIIDNLMYRHWNKWLDGKYKHLFIYNLNDKSLKDITPGPYHSPPISLGSSHDIAVSPEMMRSALSQIMMMWSQSVPTMIFLLSAQMARQKDKLAKAREMTITRTIRPTENILPIHL